MRFSATSAEKNIKYSIEHHCPQCGAPVFLDEADRFFACPYCRVKSCISQKGFGRYFLPVHKEVPPENKLIFLPYWRFKGVQYACTLSGVEHRFSDLSCLALDKALGPIPFSLGFRSQALPLKRVSARTRGLFVQPRPLGESMEVLTRQHRDRAKKALIREDIGEATSLIYSPYYMDRDQVFDAVLNKALGPAGPAADIFETGAFCRPEKETLVLSGVCPACGWDLEGRSDSLVLTCRNCHSLWQPREKSWAVSGTGLPRPVHRIRS